MKTTFILFVLLLGACTCSFAQPGFDTSGDNLLNGTYYMRQILFFSYQGTLTQTVSVQGTISFNGSGGYTFAGMVLDSQVSSSPQPLNLGNGTYSVTASGEGSISSVYHIFPEDSIIGLVSHGVFVGSTIGPTNGYSDLLIAVPIGSGPTNATLNGAYAVAYIDPSFLPSAKGRQGGDGFFTMTADGNGNFGSISATTYLGSNATATTQSLSGVTYAFNNGAAQVKFGGTSSGSNLIGGTQLLYSSPDGNFIFGGNVDGYDMFVGVRAASSPPSNYDGLYYQAGLNFNESTINSNYALVNGYYGSFQAFSGQILGEETLSSTSELNYHGLNSLLLYGGSNNFTYTDTYTLNSDGSSDDTAFSQHYVSSTDGTIRIGYGIGPFLALDVAFQEPAFSGSGVYLNPVGVVNAASSSPFTAQISPGEYLTLYGTGLAPSVAGATVPYPKILGGVQVFINNVAAPLSYVSATQIDVIVPYANSGNTTAEIQVVNNGITSNSVDVELGETSAGVFTYNPEGGLGYAAALHTDYSLVSTSSPAQTGETIAVYLTGMGPVSPDVGDGQAAPSNPPVNTTATPLAYVLDSMGNYKQAKVQFSGLAPGYAGLYQVNITIPTGLASGNAYLAIIETDSSTFQALLPITAGQ